MPRKRVGEQPDVFPARRSVGEQSDVFQACRNVGEQSDVFQTHGNVQEQPDVSQVNRRIGEQPNIIQPSETIKGIYEKANKLLHKPNAVVFAPGCDSKARMIESTRFKERPHLVTPRKRKGEYRCEKNCPHYDGIHICSHTVSTAEHNDELLNFLWWFQQSYSRKGVNLSSKVKTDIPKNPGRKSGVPSTAKRSSKKLPIAERVKRIHQKRCTDANAKYQRFLCEKNERSY